MGKIININNSSCRHGEYRYGLYTHKLITVDGEVYTRHFIVVKNRFDLIVRFTRLHNYVDVYEGKVFVPIVSDAEAKLRYVCMMLNYIMIENYDKYHIDHVFKVTREVLECFFRDYAQETLLPGNKHRGKQSVEKCVYSVTMFFRKLRRKFGSDLLLGESDLVSRRYMTNAGIPKRKCSRLFKLKGSPITNPSSGNYRQKHFRYC
jgi:hypothetical protein